MGGRRLEPLRPDKRGPKKPSTLTDELGQLIRAARAEGRTLAQIAADTGVSTATVRRALSGGAVEICEGASLPFVGALLILPALAVTGLLEASEKVLGLPEAAFYSLRSLLLSLVFCALLGECRAEGLTRMDPPALGRLIGLDRAPEVKTIRRRMLALAGLRRSEEPLMALARHHAAAHPEAMGVLYLLTELNRKEFLVTG